MRAASVPMKILQRAAILLAAANGSQAAAHLGFGHAPLSYVARHGIKTSARLPVSAHVLMRLKQQ